MRPIKDNNKGCKEMKIVIRHRIVLMISIQNIYNLTNWPCSYRALLKNENRGP